MSAYKNQQHRLVRGSHQFHFVSYDGQPSNPRRGEPATVPMWYLMRAGKRWPVMPQVLGVPDSEVTQALTAWLDSQGIA
ncbi:MAG: hypothetical protein Q7S20_12445 [Gemmatimonadaceae bacterium]|nr:hypothetical protein [Gemmatimonadaceae bacterium]